VRTGTRTAIRNIDNLLFVVKLSGLGPATKWLENCLGIGTRLKQLDRRAPMGKVRSCAKLCAKATALLLILLFHPGALAQEPAFITSKTTAFESSTVSNSVLPEAPTPHRFWDRQNRVLFSTVAIFSGIDFAVTRANLEHGGRELNPVTRLFSGSTTGLAMNFAGETAGVIGLGYFLHRTGHHRLERLAPAANIAASAFAVAFDLAHR
jgi:hypothetical protein